MARILITDCDHPSIDLERDVFVSAGFDVRLAQCRTEAEVIAEGQGALALLTQYAPITDAVMAALPSLLVVGRYGVSVDNIDVVAAERRGLGVTNVPDYCTEEVADHALGLILALTRGIAALDRGVQAGTWDFRLGGELQRSSTMQVGVIGIGRIGSALARRALALGFIVVAADPRQPVVDGVRLISLDELLATSDVVTLHVPLDPSTRQMIGAAQFRQMKRGVFLVNTSRGAVIDQAALVAALRDGRVAAAALDVLEKEPIPSGDPLLELPNVVLTPHAAFYSAQSLVDMKRRAAQKLVTAIAERQARAPGR